MDSTKGEHSVIRIFSYPRPRFYPPLINFGRLSVTTLVFVGFFCYLTKQNPWSRRLDHCFHWVFSVYPFSNIPWRPSVYNLAINITVSGKRYRYVSACYTLTEAQFKTKQVLLRRGVMPPDKAERMSWRMDHIGRIKHKSAYGHTPYRLTMRLTDIG